MMKTFPCLPRIFLHALAISSAALAAHAVTLNPVADTDTQSDVAAGTNATLNISQWNVGLLKFDISSVSGTVSSGKLRVYLPTGSAATTYTVAMTSNDTWTEGGTKPTAGSAITTKAVGTLGTGYIEFDITGHVQTKLSGNKIVSVAITSTLSGWTSWNSRQSSSNKPELVITTGSGSTTTNLTSNADTDTQSDVAAGTNATLNVSQWNVGFMKFSLSSITGGVSGGTLRVYFPTGTAATTYTVSTTNTDTWVEGGTKPTAGGAITTKAVGALGAGYIDFDVTSHVQSKMAGNKIVSVALTNTLGGWTSWNARESTTNKPLLVVTTGGGGTSVPAITSSTSASATVGSPFTYTITATNSPTSFGATNLSGTGLSLNTTTGVISGTPTTTGVISSSLTATNSAGTSAPVTLNINVGSSGTVQRPSYNTGTGFFVLNGKLYDKNGVEFHIRGLNKTHWDFASTGMWNTNANAWRFLIDFTQPTSTNLNIMNDAIAHHAVPIPGNWEGTCDDEPVLDSIVTTWVNQASAWRTIDDKMLLNIANEVGTSNSTAWRDAYINAVTRLRNAGYKCPIVVDTGGCGQDPDDIANFATAVFNADPQKNIIFDVHIYGNWTSNGSPTWAVDLNTGFNRLKNTGLCILVGEFGPGRNVGPSPTLLTPGEIINAADARNFGWLAWSWDDNPAGGDNWFALCANMSLNYNSSADLTTFGKDVIENTSYGLKVKAVKQTAF